MLYTLQELLYLLRVTFYNREISELQLVDICCTLITEPNSRGQMNLTTQLQPL